MAIRRCPVERGEVTVKGWETVVIMPCIPLCYSLWHRIGVSLIFGAISIVCIASFCIA